LLLNECLLSVYFVIDSVRKLLDTPSYFDMRGGRKWREAGEDCI